MSCMNVKQWKKLVASWLDWSYLNRSFVERPGIQFFFLCSCTAVAFGLQILFFFLDSTWTPDEVEYLMGGSTLASTGRFLPGEFPPFILLLLAPIAYLTGENYPLMAVLALSFLCALRVWGIFGCATCLWKDRRFAYAAAFCGAVHPYLVRLGGNILRDGLYFTICCFALYSLMRAAKNYTNRWYVAYAALALLGGLTRKEGIELLIIFIIVQIGVCFRLRASRNRIRRQLACMIVLPLVVLGALKSCEQLLAGYGCQWRIDTKIRTFFQENFDS